MRLLCLALFALTLVTQYPLWWGKGGWLSVRGLQAEVKAETDTNQALAARNNALAAEVQDLKTGTSAVEERARYELNMIREGEYFVQILPPEAANSAGSSPSGAASPNPPAVRAAPASPTRPSRPGRSANPAPARR